MIRKNKWIYVFIALTLIFTSLPFSTAQAVTETEVGQLFSKFDTRNNGNWYKDYNNENGVLAWDESYVMRAYLEMYQATKDTKYLDKFIVHGDSVLKQRDSERGVTDYRGLSLPAWRGGTRYTGNGTYKIFDVHTAMIAYPYAQFATIVNHSSSLSAYKSYADKYLKAAKDAVAVHDGEWTETATEMYLNRPFNMTLSLGGVFLEIYQASGDVSYKNKAVKIATHFKNNLTLDTASNSYLWKYMRTGSYGYEDLSHGAIDIDFAYLAYKNNVVFNATDMERFGNTIQKKMIKADGTIANRVDGTGTGANQNFIGLWLNFHPWASSLFDAAYKKVSVITAPQGEDLLSAGLLNRVYREKNGGLPDPTPPTPVNDKPQITVPGGVDGQYVKGELVLTADVNDDGQVAKVIFSYGTSSSGPWTEIGAAALASGTAKSGTWSLNWPTQSLADGTYWIKATAVDDQKAESQASYGRVIKDTAVPLVSKKVPENNEVIQTPVSLSVTFNEPVQNVNGENFYIEGVTGQVKYDAGTRTAVLTTTSVLKENTAYKAVLTSGITDSAGNKLSETTWTIKTGVNQPSEESMINGNFSSGKTGWSGADVSLKSETNGNQYAFAPYGWAFFQDLKLAPGEYKLNAKTRKGTAASETRIVVMFIDAAGKRTVAYEKLYKHQGAGWESIPEQTITVPKTAVTTRVYLLTNGGSGAHGFDDISLQSKIAAPAVPAQPSMMINGNFTNGTSGWSGADVSVKSESNGNKYGSAVYGWAFFQDLKLAPGEYKLNAKTRKGTLTTEARIVVMFIDAAGKRTVGYEKTYKHSGTGWENMPEVVINVPQSAVTTRIYLLTNGGSGYHDFDDLSLVK